MINRTTPSILVAALVTIGIASLPAAAQSQSSGAAGGSSAGSTSGSTSGSKGDSSGASGAAKSSTSGASSAGSSGAADLAHQDKKFVEDALQDGLAEVETGKLAASQGSSEAVKRFGNQMAQDHGKANSELQSIAQSKGVKVPDEPDMKHRMSLKRLQGMTGTDFDQKYAESAGVKDHKADIKLYEDEAKNGKDADLKAFASKTLPTLQQHLKMAQDMEQSVKSAGKGK